MDHLIKLPDQRNVLYILIIFYAVGILGLTYPPTKSYFEILSPYTLIMNMALLLLYHKPWSLKHMILYISIAITGLLVEIVGVETGLVFGDYHYKDVLGAKFLNTPLIIGINWLMLIYFAYHLTGLIRLPRWLKIIAGALLMVNYDLVLEPVAIRMNMWSWPGGDIPLQNYIAWFIISMLFLSLLHAFKIKESNRIATGLFAIQAGFILSLNLIYHFI